MLAEGATGAVLRSRRAARESNNTAAPVTIKFLKEDGTVITAGPHAGSADGTHDPRRRDLWSGGHGGFRRRDIEPRAAAGRRAHDEVGRDRLRRAHRKATARTGDRRGNLAEGSQGYFSTFLLLANPERRGEHGARDATSAKAKRRSSATTICCPRRATRSIAGRRSGTWSIAPFGIEVTFDHPGLAERATYFGTNPFWSGGHASAGSTALVDAVVPRGRRDRQLLHDLRAARESERRYRRR